MNDENKMLNALKNLLRGYSELPLDKIDFCRPIIIATKLKSL